LTPLSTYLGTTPFDIELIVRLQPKRAFGIDRNGRSTSPKYALEAPAIVATASRSLAQALN
jgi:hypothetical protein